MDRKCPGSSSRAGSDSGSERGRSVAVESEDDRNVERQETVDRGIGRHYPGEPVVEFLDVRCGYAAREVISSVSFRIRAGELVTLLGPNGAGKSTILKTILGLLKPWGGTVRMFGRAIASTRDFAACRLHMAYLPQIQTPPAVPVTVFDAVLLGRWGKHFAWVRRPHRADRAQVYELLEMVGMADLAERDLRRLSGGQRQRAALAQALAREPSLLLLDEPTTYLDSEAKQDLLERITELHRAFGLTTVMVTHEQLPGRAFDRFLRVEAGQVHDLSHSGGTG